MRRYRYVGPPSLRDEALTKGRPGHPITSAEDVADLVGQSDPGEPYTYTVGTDGVLRLAPRRSEHVACAGGGDVLAAGEIAFERRDGIWAVTEVSNQSTGYCPDVTCWPAVAAALDRAGPARPGRFTAAFHFRRCPECGEVNVVKDGDYTCALCGTALPEDWNVS